MAKYLKEMKTIILMIGTCSFYLVDSAFSKGTKKVFYCTFQDIFSSEKDQRGSFNMDNFFQDLHFFF